LPFFRLFFLHGLYKSLDNGLNWKQVETNGLELLTGNALFNFKGKLFMSGTIVQAPMEFSIYNSAVD